MNSKWAWMLSNGDKIEAKTAEYSPQEHHAFEFCLPFYFNSQSPQIAPNQLLVWIAKLQRLIDMCYCYNKILSGSFYSPFTYWTSSLRKNMQVHAHQLISPWNLKENEEENSGTDTTHTMKSCRNYTWGFSALIYIISYVIV